jgi:hypothetical protein
VTPILSPALVTSAGAANGGGYNAVLSFDAEGELMGPFSSDPQIVAAVIRFW